MNKPNGQTELKNNVDEIMKFLKDLPIGKVSGKYKFKYIYILEY